MRYFPGNGNASSLRCLVVALTCGFLVFFDAGCSRKDATESTAVNSVLPKNNVRRQRKATNEYSYTLNYVINETDQEYGLDPAFKNHIESLAREDGELVWAEIENAFPSGVPADLRLNLIRCFTGILQMQDAWIPNARIAAITDVLTIGRFRDDYCQHISKRLTEDSEALWLDLESAHDPNTALSLLNDRELLASILKTKQSAWLIEEQLLDSLQPQPEPWQDRVIELHSFLAESPAVGNRERLEHLMLEDIQTRCRMSLRRSLLYWCKKMHSSLTSADLRLALRSAPEKSERLNIAAANAVSKALAEKGSDLSSKRALSNAIESYASRCAVLFADEIIAGVLDPREADDSGPKNPSKHTAEIKPPIKNE